MSVLSRKRWRRWGEWMRAADAAARRDVWWSRSASIWMDLGHGVLRASVDVASSAEGARLRVVGAEHMGRSAAAARQAHGARAEVADYTRRARGAVRGPWAFIGPWTCPDCCPGHGGHGTQVSCPACGW